MIKVFKKVAFRRGQASKIDNPHTLLPVFQNAQGSQKGVKLRAKMEPLGIQKHKNPQNESTQKKDLKKDRKKSQNRGFWGQSVNSLFSKKSDNGSRNRPNGPRDSKMSARASKSIRKLISQTSEMSRKKITQPIKNKTLELKIASR